jgi:hypothetical protein
MPKEKKVRVILEKDERKEYFSSIENAWKERLRTEKDQNYHDDEKRIDKKVKNAIKNDELINGYNIKNMLNGFKEYLRDKYQSGSKTGSTMGAPSDAFYLDNDDGNKILGYDFQEILSFKKDPLAPKENLFEKLEEHFKNKKTENNSYAPSYQAKNYYKYLKVLLDYLREEKTNVNQKPVISEEKSTLHSTSKSSTRESPYEIAQLAKDKIISINEICENYNKEKIFNDSVKI